MKQTAVEWLKPQIELMLMDGHKSYPNELEEVFEIAKEMEKQQQDESAIEFSKWCLDIGIYNQFKKTQGINKELLEIYKKEKEKL